jgi:GT2 family glycosyltransferase
MESSHPPAEEFVVVICTRERPDQLDGALAALDAQTHRDFGVLVVDQSREANVALSARAECDPRLTVVRDSGTGLSRARNIAWRATHSEWLVFVDDDCLPEADWAEQLARAFSEHPEAAFVSGLVIGHNRAPDAEGLEYSVFPVERAHVVSGRWVWPHRLGFGVCHAVRRSMIERVGGWDERLGPGVREFPASDDMDFNFRVLRAGGVAYVTPAVRSHHEQWRTSAAMAELFEGYMASWAGFAVKTLRTGDPLGGLWLWGFGVADVLRMVASAVKHRSRFRLGVAARKARGLGRGTAAALARRW